MPSPRPSVRSGSNLPPRPGGPAGGAYGGPAAQRKQEAQRKKRIRIAGVTLFAVAALVFGMAWNPPTTTVHKFSESSNFNVATDSGCTNSGDGCHGEETGYSDFNKYHPDTECGDCHDYTGVACIPCHSPNSSHDCQLCHDGSMKKAPDVVRLTDSYPNGHYRETTHTAVGTDYKTPVRATPAGEASATCDVCHSRDLRKSHTGVPIVAGSDYGPDIGCGECHNDAASFGLAEVKAEWKSHKCEACHKVGSSSPMHPVDSAGSVEASSSPGCTDSGAGCHDVSDLHLMHANAPKDCSGSAVEGEPACHTVGAQALKPTAKSCGGDSEDSCHRAGSSGTYDHKTVDSIHSPTNGVPSAAVFMGVTCGACHEMEPDGISLMTEHELSTSATSDDPDACINCHNHIASGDAIDDNWAARDTTEACQACHGRAGLAGVHGTDIGGLHTATSVGCSSSGPGCHPTGDLSEVGDPTTTQNIHANCLRCHDRTASNGNAAYDPDRKTCGAGRDCHNGAGQYNPATSVHTASIGGSDASHLAGSNQKSAKYTDLDTGVQTACGSCHDMSLGDEHERPNSVLASGNSCTGCHNQGEAPEVVKSKWGAQGSSSACAECHPVSGVEGQHSNLRPAHVGTELGPDGTPTPGSCVTSGCHSSADLRKLHAPAGCAIDGCHSAEGNIFGRNVRSCGGGNSFTACHTGYSATNHFVSHAADLSGNVNGISYFDGANVGCFGCHDPDLRAEHLRELNAGSMEGGGANNCRVCHYDAGDPGNGAYSSDSAVVNAIAKRDLRCKTCHASGSAADSSSAVASAHKNITADNPLPVGRVWADPFDGWKAAYEATATGGGHNGPSASLVGASQSKRFPVTEFAIGGTTYTWVLPANSGATTWLRASVFGAAAVSTPESIRQITVQCDDCHALPEDMAGTHGSAVHVGIDPNFSQTEYANPTTEAYQFTATGNQRVICMKCHNMEASTNPIVDPGGSPLHSRHVKHDDLPPSDPHHYGEKCIDCHVRIPHAWRRPRLLVRTVVTTDGAVPDAYPYVPAGYNGLAGIVLRSYEDPTDLRSRYCATGGLTGVSCHPGPSSTRHPLPSDIPTAMYWP